MPEGSFVGGPLDGMTYTLRTENSVLAVDPELGVACLYYTEGDGNYYVRIDKDTDPVTGSMPYDEDRAIAAVEAGYEVIVVPGEKPTQEEIDEEEVLTDGE